MMYYVDCSCPNHDYWREFARIESAKDYFKSISCTEKILYDEDFETIMENAMTDSKMGS